MTDAQYVVSADGTKIAWYDFGGDGPDLLLAHASGFCAAMWAEVARELSDFHCVAFDTRGHGLSDAPGYGQDGWNWQRFADDAIAVIGAANLEHPYGIGHSSGGATEVLVEERSPGTFKALYCFEPILFNDPDHQGPWPERELAVRTRKRRDRFDTRSAAHDAFTTRGPFTTLSPTALDAYLDHGFAEQRDGSIVLRCAPENEAWVYTMATDHSGFDELAKVACRVTFAHGELSTSFEADEVRNMSQRAPGGTFAEFDGLGHFGPLEDPVRFATSVRQALMP